MLSNRERIGFRPVAAHGLMNLDKLILELRRERDSISEAISALERLLPNPAQHAAGDDLVKRPGRPPGSRNKPLDSTAPREV